jgi:molybdate transport system regulatory protein
MPNKPKASKPGGKRRSRYPQTGYTIRASVWVEKNGELYLGGGRVMLLERLDKLGSIAAAARSMRLSYRNAWLWIEAMTCLAHSPLVEKIAGGAGGGHAKLTQEGHSAIALYKELRNRMEDLLRQESSYIDHNSGIPDIPAPVNRDI